MNHIKYIPGDPVIFRKTKYSNHPGPPAKDIQPAPHGETYAYEVDKFWVVAESRHDGTLVLRTRRGKSHQISAADPNLRRPYWWEKLLYRDRFPRLADSAPQHQIQMI